MSDEAAADLERELEGELEQGEAGEPPLEVTAEFIGPPLPQAGSQSLIEHVAQMLEELQQQGVDLEPGEVSPGSQQVLDELRDELRDELGDGPSSSGAGPSGAGPSGSSDNGAGPSVSS